MPDLPSLELMQQRLDTWRERYRVAGATLAVMLDDDVRAVASGVINTRTGVEATPDTLFQVGSITKVYTTTLIMQFVDEGRIDLDAPARTYLPGLRFGDERTTETATIRHLLTHTSGVDGDFFEDFGRGDDCVERYVAACATLPSLFAPGAMWSYCNAGFVVLGRIIETMLGMSWDRALRERLLDPLGVRDMVTLPEEALMYRTAVGHTFDAQLQRTLAPRWDMPRAQAPAGSTPCATVDALLAFARMHIDGGRARDGAQVLSGASVRAMQDRHASLPGGGEGQAGWGLGWMRFNWSGRHVVGHDGGTIGQNSSLRVLPDERFAVAVLTNTNFAGGLLAGRVMRWLFGEVADVETPARPKPPEDAPQFDLAPYAGTYEKVGTRTTFALRDGALWVQYTGTGPLPSTQMPEQRLFPVSETSFLQQEYVPGVFSPVSFHNFEDGRRAYFFSGYRLARRVD
jgi:CubicO group peptidase (beta-lactamase class C family)